jgi:hypothetical protein
MPSLRWPSSSRPCLVERMNARPGGFALNLSGSRRSGSTGSWSPTRTALTRPIQ